MDCKKREGRTNEFPRHCDLPTLFLFVYISISYLFLLFTILTTTGVSANSAIAFGITIRLLNRSVSSQTKSLDIIVPMKIKANAITVYIVTDIFVLCLRNRYATLIFPYIFQLNVVENAKKNRHTATNIDPKVSPKTVPKAVCARFVFPSISTISPVYPFARIPSDV